MTRVIFFLFTICLAGCGGPYMGKDYFGADEFVLDSYKIREGKLSILEMEGIFVDELDEELLEESQDKICEGDVLQVALNHPKYCDAMGGYQIQGGKIFLPDLAPLQVAGLTLEQASEKIQELYQAQALLVFQKKVERVVELMGLTERSSVVVDGQTRLFDVLSQAKIAANANFFKSYVVREDKMLPVDLRQLVQDGDMEQNIVMQGGDKIYIAKPEASTLMVIGEVEKEKEIALPNGFMSLRSALANAGGISAFGKPSYIQVIRGDTSHPKIYMLDWEHVVRLPNDSLLLMPGDIVYVSANPITEWLHSISRLLPNFSGK